MLCITHMFQSGEKGLTHGNKSRARLMLYITHMFQSGENGLTRGNKSRASCSTSHTCEKRLAHGIHMFQSGEKCRPAYLSGLSVIFPDRHPELWHSGDTVKLSADWPSQPDFLIFSFAKVVRVRLHREHLHNLLGKG